MQHYGFCAYRGGFELHGDGRHWVKSPWGWWYAVTKRRLGGRGRGEVGGFTEASRKRLEFLAACVATEFRSHVTLTYHAAAETWDDADRNRRIAQRSKQDLNRFLASVRGSMGHYVWAQEFQERGVVHFQLLCEREVSEERMRVAWCRATDELDDPDALEHAVMVRTVWNQREARSYLCRYVGKARQKMLPAGIERCGRWWGASRGMTLAVLEEVMTCATKDCRIDPCGARIVRSLRKYLSKRMGFKFRGGAVVDWSGALTRRLVEMARQLREFYGRQELPNARRTAWDVPAATSGRAQ